jgi:hypothetical protein
VSLKNPYCTVAQVQAEIRNDQVTLVNQIEDAINQASRWIDDYVGRDFFQHDFSVTPLRVSTWDQAVFDETLFLPYRPVIELTAVQEGDTLLAVDVDYIAKEGRLIRLGARWVVGDPPDNDIELTGKFGYAQTAVTAVPADLPDQINRAAILVAAAFTGHNRKQIVGLDGSKEEVIDKAIPRTVFDILGRRRSVIV